MNLRTCPQGHVSGDPDWCDTCGAPMNTPGDAAAHVGMVPSMDPGAAAAATAPIDCPHCGAANPGDNLFCESCGYDFTTGQPPPVPEPAAGRTTGPGAEPSTVPPGAAAETSAAPAADPSLVSVGPVAADWIVVVEVDPLWFSVKGELADRPLPAPSTSTVPLMGHVSMIGRTSQSRGVRPEVALDTDTAVSRRHAQLVLEDARVSVIDLSSTNGTYVVLAGSVPADDAVPLAAGVPHVLHDGDQVYLGAWTRLTLRRT